MKKYLLFFTIIAVLTSCRRNFATFQPSYHETFERANSNSDSKLALDSDSKLNSHSDLKIDSYSSPKLEIQQSDLKIQIQKMDFKKPDKKETIKTFKSTLKEQIKEKRRRGGLFNRGEEKLKIGLILLGVAIIFALLSIEILAIVFGLVAAWMIIQGLRRML